MTLLVRDEADILRANLDFHLAQGVDQVILMDNLSTDATAEIAREYERAGRLVYLWQPEDNYAQGRWVTQMSRMASVKFGADWVINTDADEFWWPAEGSLRDVLAEVPSTELAVSVDRTNFVARADESGPFWCRMDVRTARSTNMLGEPLPGKVAHRGSPDVTVEQGNHAVRFTSEPAATAAARISILHFPLRTRAQFRNKIAKGGAAYARNSELDPNVGRSWRQLYESYLEGKLDDIYEQLLMSDAEIDRGLAQGDLIRDVRLRSAMSAGFMPCPRSEMRPEEVKEHRGS